MKKTAYVFTDDFGHPKSTILPLLPKIFDYGKWHVCAMDSIEDICLMPTAPDLIVTFQVGNRGIIDNQPSWYESSPFTYQWMRWVREDGCGLLIIHGGLCFIPADHPVIIHGTIGHFSGHPAACPVHIEPIMGKNHPITDGITPFDIESDEHFQIDGIDETKMNILAYSTSETGGRQPAVWTNEVGCGRVAVLTPGHASEKVRPLEYPQMIRMMSQAVSWCGKEYSEQEATA